MESYIIKIYPHKYMDRAEQDHFAADNIAFETSLTIKDMLDSMSCVKYEDQSSNESYEYLILNPKHPITVNVKYRIRTVLPEVSFIKTWIHVPEIDDSKKLTKEINEHNRKIGLSGIDRNFQEDMINEMDSQY